jgi:hypothetical protein
MGVIRRCAHIIVFCGLAPGCFWATTKHEGEVMQEQIKNLDGRLKGQEEALGALIGRSRADAHAEKTDDDDEWAASRHQRYGQTFLFLAFFFT